MFPPEYFISSGSVTQTTNQRGDRKKIKTMNILTQFKMTILPGLVALALGFVLAPATITATRPGPQAWPLPIGDYGGHNTSTGLGSCFSMINYPNPDRGLGNTASGFNALYSITTASDNTGVGTQSLEANTGWDNTSIGSHALSSNTDGSSSTAIGHQALMSNTLGNFNMAAGKGALLLNTTGGGNTAVGFGALESNTTGTSNTALGYYAGWNVSTAYNVISIGSLGDNVNNSAWIGNVYGVTTQSGTMAPVVVSSDGQLGTVASSERFKKDIATMNKTSDGILSLRPVTFHYKTDAGETPQFGLIAEEVAKVNPALVLLGKDGKPFTVRYDAVNAMLLNEFLKEHRTVQELKNEVAALTTSVKEQASQLQKVSAQLEVIRPTPRTVLNNH
jgi:Chaperone of endosialidase